MKKTLLVSLVTLSAASLTACGPGGDAGTTLVDVAQAAARQEDRVSVQDLATWLIEGRADFHLVDVRLPDEFEQGSIGEAENIPLARLVTDETLAGLPRDRRVIVYSNGAENAAKAVVMLRLSGIDAQLVTGGYNAWHARILNPEISAAALDGETLRVSKQRAYSCYFVGDRDSSAAPVGDAEPFVPPVFEAPEVTDELPPPPPEEGC